MNRIQAVLNEVGYTIINLEELTARCQGSYIKGMPRISKPDSGCTNDCRWCWEEGTNKFETIKEDSKIDKLKELINYGEQQWDGQPINKGMLEGLKEALKIMEGE